MNKAVRRVIACSDPEYVGRKVSISLLLELCRVHEMEYQLDRNVFIFRKDTWRPELGCTTRDYMEVSFLSFEEGMQQAERIAGGK